MKHPLRSHSLRFATSVALAASVCAGGVAIAGSAAADEYSVQIGAFENPDPDFAAAAEEIGKLYKSRNRNGLTRLQVGRYATEAEAITALSALAGAGYADAYVVNKSARLDAAARETVGETMRAASTVTTSRTVSSRRSGADNASLLGNVPPELRGRTVLLDGRLHVVEGDRFIPLREYLAGRR